MAEKNCSACGELRSKTPEFVQKGVTSTVCTSLKNNTGFNPGNSDNDCTDLDRANDCLIGNMEDEINAYKVCDWKSFMKKYIYNNWTMFKALICTMCGLWARVAKHDCEIKFLFEGYTFRIGEDPDDGSYVVAGKGVSFRTRVGGEGHTSDVHITYIGGALARGGGSLEFFTKDWQEPDNEKVYNFDNEDTVRVSYNRKGNEYWDTNKYEGDTVGGNELIYEIRIKKSQYPQIKSIIGMFGQSANVGNFQVQCSVFDGDNVDDDEPTKYAYGQHGSCDKNGNPEDISISKFGTKSSKGHAVPKGWIYVQLRMQAQLDLVHGEDSSRKPTPIYFLGLRFNRGSIDC